MKIFNFTRRRNATKYLHKATSGPVTTSISPLDSFADVISASRHAGLVTRSQVQTLDHRRLPLVLLLEEFARNVKMFL